jgi:hypothetical protein
MKSTRNNIASVISRVPALTQEHVADLLESKAKASALIRRLTRQKLISVTTESVQGRKIYGPLETVYPGKPLPDAGAIAYRAARLWTSEWSPRIIIRGTVRLALLSGNEPVAAITGHVSHVLALTDVLLRKLRENPDFEWKLVTSRPGLGAQPDAISVDGTLQIEIIGRYNCKTTASKLALAANATLELW